MKRAATLDLDELDHLLRSHRWEALTEILEDVPTWEILDNMRRLPMQRQALLYRLLGKEVALAVFEQLAPPLQTNLVAGLRDEELTSLIEDLDPDDRVALFDELPAKVVDRLLQGLSPQERTGHRPDARLPVRLHRTPHEP